MSSDAVTTSGVEGIRPGRDATTGVHAPPGGGGPRRRREGPAPEPRSYYGQPILNKPVWESPDIPGYFFLGGLAGAGAAIGAAAQLTGRRRLARVSKLGAAAAGHLSFVGLIHDLGRRGRFLNMLRVFKVTSPMSVGSWLLAGFVPAATVSAFCDVTGLLPVAGGLATAGAATLGPPVAAYTAALIGDTAVPAWHEGHRLMPLVFVSSGLSAAGGLALLGAPTDEVGPARVLGAAGALAEVGLSKLMEKRMGMVEEAYHEGRADIYMKAAEVLSAGGAVLALASRRRRVLSAAAGAALIAGSAFERFGVFHAGLNSVEDPKYTVVPQRERMARRSS